MKQETESRINLACQKEIIGLKRSIKQEILPYLLSKFARGRLTLHLLENGPFHVDVGFLLEVDGAGALEQRARGRHAVLLHVGHVL